VFIALGGAVALVVLLPVGKAGVWAWTRWRPSVATVGAACLPVLAFAFVNRAAGQYLVPNSVAAKSTWGSGRLLPDLSTIMTKLGRDRLVVVVLLLVVAALVFALVWRLNGRAGALLALVVASMLHLTFANVGWFDRYQAYLIVAGVGIVLPVVGSRPFPATSVAATAVGVVLIALAVPRLTLLTQVPGAAQNVHEQQQQMAEFFAEHYEHDAIAVNDLGYVAWLHDGPVTDLAGLGSFQVLEAAKQGRADRAFFEDLAERRGIRVVATYADLFGGSIPESWTPVERWCLRDELVTAADDCVTFYGTSAEEALRLATALDSFDAGLPEAVERFRMFAP
jgi:hypothetical protein